MVHYYPESRTTRYGVVLVGVGIALCAFVLGWVVRLWMAPSEPLDNDPRPSTAQPSSPTDQSAVAGPRDDLLTRCRQVFTAQQPVLSTGAAAISQWSVHIGAMNKLVAGEISLAQATAYWNQTRVGAQEQLDQYAAAVGSYDARTVHCPRPAAQDADEATAACSRAVVARNHELAALRAALGRWQTHVRHMEMLRLGEMSPSRAVTLWLKNWRQGQTEVHAYRAAFRHAQGLHC